MNVAIESFTCVLSREENATYWGLNHPKMNKQEWKRVQYFNVMSLEKKRKAIKNKNNAEISNWIWISCYFSVLEDAWERKSKHVINSITQIRSNSMDIFKHLMTVPLF